MQTKVPRSVYTSVSPCHCLVPRRPSSTRKLLHIKVLPQHPFPQQASKRGHTQNFRKLHGRKRRGASLPKRGSRWHHVFQWRGHIGTHGNLWHIVSVPRKFEVRTPVPTLLEDWPRKCFCKTRKNSYFSQQASFSSMCSPCFSPVLYITFYSVVPVHKRLVVLSTAVVHVQWRRRGTWWSATRPRQRWPCYVPALPAPCCNCSHLAQMWLYSLNISELFIIAGSAKVEQIPFCCYWQQHQMCVITSFLLEVNVLFYCMLLTRFSDWNFINDKFCQLYKLQCNWNSYSIHYKHVWWKYDTLYQVPKCVEIYAWSSKPGNQYVHCNQISTMPGSTINSLHCTWKADCTPHYLHSSWQWEKWSKQMLDVERGHEGSKLLEIDNRSLGCPKFCLLSVQFSSCLCQLVHPSHFLFLCGISIALKKMVTFGMGPHSFSYYAVPSLSVTASSALQISRGLPHLCIVFSFQSQSTPPSCRRPSSWWNNALRDSFLLHSVLVAFGDQLVPVQIPHPACKKKRK